MKSCSLISEVSLTNNCKDNSFLDNNSLTKNKSEKSKDSKSLISENITNDIKNAQCQVKAQKAHKDVDELNMQKKENVKEKQKSNNAENVVKEKKKTNFSNDVSENYNTKEVKEKKNKADTRHRNRKPVVYCPPSVRNKQQLPIQVHTVMHIYYSMFCVHQCNTCRI